MNAICCGVALGQTHPSAFPVEKPIDLSFNRPAYTTFIHVGITAWPITPLVGRYLTGRRGKITPAALRGSVG